MYRKPMGLSILSLVTFGSGSRFQAAFHRPLAFDCRFLHVRRPPPRTHDSQEFATAKKFASKNSLNDLESNFNLFY
jgi:hypothetical protein